MPTVTQRVPHGNRRGRTRVTYACYVAVPGYTSRLGCAPPIVTETLRMGAMSIMVSVASKLCRSDQMEGNLRIIRTLLDSWPLFRGFVRASTSLSRAQSKGSARAGFYGDFKSLYVRHEPVEGRRNGTGSCRKRIRFHILLLGTLLVLVLSNAAGAAPPYQVNMSMEVFGNTIDGSQGPRCDVLNEVETGKKTEWWITLGEARPDPRGGWEGVNNGIRCGGGFFKERNVGSGSSSQSPYLIAVISTLAAVSSNRIGPEKVLQVEVSLSLQKFSGFDVMGKPRYEQSTEKRAFFLENGTAF